MAPCNLRGALNILFQLAVTIGIFAAQLINYGTQVSRRLAARSLTLPGLTRFMLGESPADQLQDVKSASHILWSRKEASCACPAPERRRCQQADRSA